MGSIWSLGVERGSFPALRGSARCDVLIVGGGIAGILCAHALKAAGVDCILVEADKICSGITGNTTAKITVQHGFIYHKLIKRFGREGAGLYLKAQERALDEYKSLCRNIDCDLEERDSYVYSLNERDKLERELWALESLGARAELSDAAALPFSVAGAVRMRGQAQFNPLKFLFSIARGLPIYENTKVRELAPWGAITEHGEIRSEKTVIATHFPVLNKHGAYFLKLYQHRSYVLALRGAGDVGGMYIDGSGEGLSFRNRGNMLLLGGGSHRTGKRGGGYGELEAAAREYYPDAKISARWATQDCMSLDGVPYIGRYARNTPNIYVSTGFNKWGMTSAMVSAMILSDLILGRKSEYAEFFSPSRSIFTHQLAINALESVRGLLTPTVPRCPHLGCALKYNREEHSWDCPCHGSRFGEDGKLIDNPATDDKRIK